MSLKLVETLEMLSMVEEKPRPFSRLQKLFDY
jgi:hypothetical protein